jgi:hypothetical protein
MTWLFFKKIQSSCESRAMAEQINLYHYLIAVPFMGRMARCKGMALATSASLAKANIFLHLTVD